MDILFVITIFILIVIIVVYAVGNRVVRTKDLELIMTKLMNERPTAVAFTLGRVDGSSLYDNVYRDKLNELYVKRERYPITPEGKRIVDAPHGDVSERPDGNGFVISGMEFVEFKCPPGYEHRNCMIEPLCDSESAGRYRTIDYTQFNALHLYRNDFKDSRPRSIDPESLPEEAVHPRIRAFCHTDGHYELETCPDNQLLDPKSVECRVYDICEDHMNGYKHNYQINDHDPPLSANEYYLCQSNVSVKMKCAEGTVFSDDFHGCVNVSRCADTTDDRRLALDDKHYIQCRGGVGRIVNCPDGVTGDEAHGDLACRNKICKPTVYTFDDGVLQFDTGADICMENDDVPRRVTCDTAPTPRTFRANWLEDFVAYTYDKWPKRIYSRSSQSCVPPTETIVKPDAKLNVKWSGLMSQAHPFYVNVQHGRVYECGEEYKYRWDYLHDTLVPDDLPPPSANSTRMFVDTAAPCQTEATSNDSMPWQGCKLTAEYPRGGGDGRTNLAGVYAVACQSEFHEDVAANMGIAPVWPYYDSESKLYGGATIMFVTDGLTAVHYESSLPPVGFLSYDEGRASGVRMKNERIDDKRTRLKLRGVDESFYEAIHKEYDTRVWYHIATGRTDRLVFDPTGLRESKKITFEYRNRIDTSLDVPTDDGVMLHVPIAWHKIDNYEKRYDILSDDRLYITKLGVHYGSTALAPPVYSMLKLSRIGDNPKGPVLVQYETPDETVRVTSDKDFIFVLP